MKIYLNIEAEGPAELRAALAALAGVAAQVSPTSFEPCGPSESSEPANQGAVPRRGRPRKGEAVSAGAVEVTRTPAPETMTLDEVKQFVKGEHPAQQAPETAAVVAPVTRDEVREMILQLLDDWQQATPDDPDVRAKVLKPILDALGADKIKNIAEEKLPLVAGLVDDSRRALVERAAVVEE